METLVRKAIFVCGIATFAVAWSTIANAEDASASEQPAATEAAAATPASPAEEPSATVEAPAAEAAEAPAEQAPAAEQSAEPGSQAPEVPEEIVRLGRVESVLIANEDPESAIDFGQEMMREDMDSARLRLLLGSCYMQLNRYNEALEQFNQAGRMAGDDQVTNLIALYNTARALQGAGQFAEAARAYDGYVTFARAHSDLSAFVETAQRLAAALRSRAE